MGQVTRQEYLDMVTKIPDQNVRDEIQALDINYGVGNEASLGMLNDYVAGQLPSQVRKEEEEERVSRGESRRPAVDRQEHWVAPPHGATQGEVDTAYDSAYWKQYNKYYDRHYKPTKDMTEEQKHEHSEEIARRARTEGVRHVTSTYSVRLSSKGRPMVMTEPEKEQIKKILEAQGLGALWEAMKPRVYSKASLVNAMLEQAELMPEDVEEARKLLREFYWDEEMEAMYMAIRPGMKERARSVTRSGESWDQIVSEYMTAQGFEYNQSTGKWEKTETVDVPRQVVGTGEDALVFEARTEKRKLEYEAPKSWGDFLRLESEAEGQFTMPRGERGMAERGRGPRRKKRREDGTNVQIPLKGLRDAVNAAVDEEEARMVSQARQEESLSFYTDAIELVTDRARQKEMALPTAGPGRPGTEQRAIWEALPQEQRDNWNAVRALANKMARKKAEIWDLAVYPDYRAKELGEDREGNRIGRHNIPFTNIGFNVEYDPDRLHTRLFDATNDLVWSAFFRQKDPTEVAETPLMATIRSTAGGIRFLTSPFWDLISYDVDEDGNPLDPSDWNYRFSNYVDGKLEKVAAGSINPWNHAVTSFAAVAPSTMAKEVGPTRMSTGNYVKNVAVQVFNGHFLGHDFMELVDTRSFYARKGMPNAPMYFGLAVEVALPLTPWPAVKTASRFTGRTLQGVDSAFRTGKMSDLIDAFVPLRADMIIGEGPKVGVVGKTGRWLESPVREAQTGVLASIGRNITRVARGVDNIDDVADLIAKDARVPRQLAVRLSEELLNNLDFSSLESLRKSIEAMRLKYWGKNSGVAEILEDLQVAFARLDKVKKTNSIDLLKGDAQGLSLLDEIGAQLASSKSVAFSDDFNKGVMMGYLTERMTAELANYIPNRFVMVTDDVIVPLSTWNRSRRKIQAEVSKRLKTDVVDGKYKYTDPEAAAELLMDAFGPASVANTPFLRRLYKDIKAGKLLKEKDFSVIDGFLRGSIVKKIVKGSARLKVAGSAWERSKKAATSRELSLPRVVEDLYRGLNPIRRIDAMLKGRPTAPPAKIMISSKGAALEGMPLATLQFWRSTSEELVQIDRLIREEVLAARTRTGDAWGGLTEVMNSYSSGNHIDDLMNILFGKPAQRGGFFGERGSKIVWDTARRELEAHLKALTREYGSGMFDALTPGSVAEGIAFLRDRWSRELLKSGAQPAGMGKRVGPFLSLWRKYKHKSMPANPTPGEIAAISEYNLKIDLEIAAKTDYADAAVWSWMVNAKKEQIIQAKAAQFAKVYPQLVISVGKTTSEQRVMFDLAVRESLGLAGIPAGKLPALIEKVSREASDVFFGGTYTGRGLNASDMRFIMGKIIEDLYEHGAGNFLTQQRIADAIVRRMGAGAGDVGVETLTARIPELQRRVVRALERAGTGKTAKEIENLAQLIVGRAFTDLIETTTKQTIDTLMGNLSAAGFGARLDDTGVLLTDLKMTLVKISDEHSVLMPRLKEVTDPQDLLLIEDMLKQNANGMLEANLEALRARDMEIYSFYISRLGVFVDWTKRGTIGGLLGGFGPFGVFRFHGVNVLTAPLIMTVTAPKYVLTALKTMPKAATRFVKPVTEALYPAMTKAQKSLVKNVPYTDTFFNWMANRFSKNPNKIMFVDKWGSPWTRARFEAAIQSSNIRFSQVSFEFRQSILHELRRAAATKANLGTASSLRQMLRWFDPMNKSLWTRFAEEADMAYREAVFAAAIKEGIPLAEAGTLARNALLDYGSISAEERRYIANNMLFYAFRRKMMQETLATFLRHGDSLKLLGAQMRHVQNQHKISDSWIREDDWQRTRMWSKLSSEFDGVQNYTYGFASPPLESLLDFINVSYGVMDYTFLGNTKGGVRELVTDFLFLQGDGQHFTPPREWIRASHEGYLAHPLWGLVRDQQAIWSGPEGPQQMVRAEWVYAWQKMGFWNTAVKMFDIIPVKQKDRKANDYLQLMDPDGRPVYSQYRFGGRAGRSSFKLYYRLSEMMGFNRALRDWSTSAIRSDEDPDMVWKKHVANGAWGHMFGFTTPGEVPTWTKIRYDQNVVRERIYKGLNK